MTEPNETPIAEAYEDLVAERNRPRTPQHALLMAVRAGEMTPKEADEKCLADGLPLRHDGWQELHDITTNSVWWLPLAVLFYAWRDLPQTREQWERYSAWEHHLWRDPTDDQQITSLDEAETMLRSDLSAGIVRAFGSNADGIVRPIPCEAWECLAFGHGRDFPVLGVDGMAAYTGVFVLRHEVVPMLITEHAATPVMQVAAPEMRGRPGEQAPKRGGGRPTVHDWAGAAGFIARDIVENDYPSSADILAQKVEEWFIRAKGKTPAFRELQSFASEVLRVTQER